MSFSIRNAAMLAGITMLVMFAANQIAAMPFSAGPVRKTLKGGLLTGTNG